MATLAGGMATTGTQESSPSPPVSMAEQKEHMRAPAVHLQRGHTRSPASFVMVRENGTHSPGPKLLFIELDPDPVELLSPLQLS